MVSLNWRMLAKPEAKAILGELQVGGLDQHPRCLGTARAGQGERAGAELGGEQPASGGEPV